MFVINILKLYMEELMRVEQKLFIGLDPQNRQILWNTFFNFSDRNTFFFI